MSDLLPCQAPGEFQPVICIKTYDQPVCDTCPLWPITPADSHVETSDGPGWDRDTIQRIINGGGTSWSDAEHIDALLADRDLLARENAAMRRDRQRDTNADRFRAKVIGDLEAERDQLLADQDRLRRALDVAQVTLAQLATERDAARAEADRPRGDPQAVKPYADRLAALEQLLTCYRTGRQPSEALHRRLESTRRGLPTTDTDRSEP